LEWPAFFSEVRRCEQADQQDDQFLAEQHPLAPDANPSDDTWVPGVAADVFDPAVVLTQDKPTARGRLD